MEIKKTTLMWAVIGVLFVAALFLTFEAGAAETKTISGSANNAIDTSGWTENEKMNYEMHGAIPARVKSSVQGASAGAGMVGGC